MGFLDTVRAKLEIKKLEKRYVQRQRRRTAYEASAQYADGQYTYTTVAPTAFASPKFATTITTIATKSQGLSEPSPPSPASAPRTFPSSPSAAERRRSYFGTPSKTKADRDYLSPTSAKPVEPRAASPSYTFGRHGAERRNVLMAQWEGTKARMPSVKVTEVFGGGVVKTSNKVY